MLTFVISQRGMHRQPSRAGDFSFEDLLVEWVAHTLRGSDWAHRWRHMTRIASLQAATAVHERIARLDAEAAELLTRWL